MPAPDLRVHLLRAVNVGGAKLPMTELRGLATELGASDVSTFIASGNLLCRPPGDAEEFDRALEKGIEQRFGFFREVISRTPAELQAALDAYPFDVVEAKFCHIYFLLDSPTAEAAAAFEASDWNGDEVRVIGRDLHIRYAGGVAGTKLTPAKIARQLGHAGTGRNLLTVTTLIDRAS